jgi:hypothetical protein
MVKEEENKYAEEQRLADEIYNRQIEYYKYLQKFNRALSKTDLVPSVEEYIKIPLELLKVNHKLSFLALQKIQEESAKVIEVQLPEFSEEKDYHGESFITRPTKNGRDGLITSSANPYEGSEEDRNRFIMALLNWNFDKF